jgi:hypothetical protein
VGADTEGAHVVPDDAGSIHSYPEGTTCAAVLFAIFYIVDESADEIQT